MSLISGQILSLSKRFTNDSVKFTIGLTEPDWEKNIFYSETIVEVKSIDSADWYKIKLFDRKTWLKLLNDSNVDWIANLVLYELYRKDASFFRFVDNRKKWIVKGKEGDLAYWKRNLK